MITCLDRYILRRVAAPLVITLLIAALLLVLERMLRLFDFVVTEGGPIGVVFAMLGNLVPHYMGLALPVGLLLGVLVAFRGLSLSSEYDIAASTGLSLLRLLRPVMMLAAILTLVNILLTGWIQPYSRYTYRELVYELRSGALGASVRVGEFVDIGDDLILRVEQSRRGGRDLEGIFVEQRRDDHILAISAESGRFFSAPAQDQVVLKLKNGITLDFSPDYPTPRLLEFDEQDLLVTLPQSASFRSRGGQERELTLGELYRGRSDPTRAAPARHAINAQFHWRLVHSFSLMVLPLLAAPLGLTSRRAPSALGLVAGLATLIVYNELMEAMTGLVAAGASPWLSIWSLFAGFVMLGLGCLYVGGYRPGGDPLALVNIGWRRAGLPAARLLRRLLGIQ